MAWGQGTFMYVNNTFKMPLRFPFLSKKSQKPADIIEDATTVFQISSQEWKNVTPTISDGLLHIRETSVKSQKIFELVFKKNKDIYSLLRCFQLETAQEILETLKTQVYVIFTKGVNKLSSVSIATRNLTRLMELWPIIKDDNWTAAHISAYFGYSDMFSLNIPEINSTINEQTRNSWLTPLHIAVGKGHIASVKAILDQNHRVDLFDTEGNSPLHYAAASSKDIVSLFLRHMQSREYLHLVNRNGSTPLLVACYSGKTDIVKEFFKSNQPVSCLFPSTLLTSTTAPKYLPLSLLDDLEPEDMKYGGSPIHWAKSRKSLERILTLGFNINGLNANGETALHVEVKQQRYDCLVLLLCVGIDTEARGCRGETALHYAVHTSDLTAVQALLVFDAQVNVLSDSGLSPRHLAAKDEDSDDQAILDCLMTLGAIKCAENVNNCTDKCSASSQYRADVKPDAERLDNYFFNSTKQAVAKKQQQLQDPNLNFIRLLSLDGGGIRGLVTVQMLLEIDKRLKYPLQCYFNWFAGTSTGGIIAALMCKDLSLQHIRTIYLALKNKIIEGSKPYGVEKLEEILKHFLGSDTRMCDVTNANLSITATLGDRHPAELHFFRNYPPPAELLGLRTYNEHLYVPPTYAIQHLWEACRASAAAPTYFRAHGPFLDGGIVSNNPTLDILADIAIYRDVKKSLGHTDIVPDLGVVVSMGAGKSVTMPRPVLDFHSILSMNPAELYKNAITAKDLVALLITQTTNTDGHVVQRARAWCASLGVPYFRLSPSMAEQIAIDEANEVDLIATLWEAKAYIIQQKETVDMLISLLENWPGIRDQERRQRDVIGEILNIILN